MVLEICFERCSLFEKPVNIFLICMHFGADVDADAAAGGYYTPHHHIHL